MPTHYVTPQKEENPSSLVGMELVERVKAIHWLTAQLRILERLPACKMRESLQCDLTRMLDTPFSPTIDQLKESLLKAESLLAQSRKESEEAQKHLMFRLRRSQGHLSCLTKAIDDLKDTNPKLYKLLGPVRDLVQLENLGSSSLSDLLKTEKSIVKT